VLIFKRFEVLLDSYNRENLLGYFFEQMVKNGILLVLVTNQRITRQFKMLTLQGYRLNTLTETHGLLYIEKHLLENDPTGEQKIADFSLGSKGGSLKERLALVDNKLRRKRKKGQLRLPSTPKSELIDVQAESE
jgi:hypothetical protein